MTNEQIIALIEDEFNQKTFAVTEQYLAIHSPIYIDNKLKVGRIDRDSEDGGIVVYLPVLDESFYFAVYIDGETNQITGVDTEAHHRVYFTATSETLTADELMQMTVLPPTETWSKGDRRKHGNTTYNFSRFEIFPNPEPDAFEDKLTKLLDYLEQDKEGIKRLVEKTDGYIQVAMDIHNGNGMLGGPDIDKTTIKRMSELGLSINFDLYVGGNKFKD